MSFSFIHSISSMSFIYSVHLSQPRSWLTCVLCKYISGKRSVPYNTLPPQLASLFFLHFAAVVASRSSRHHHPKGTEIAPVVLGRGGRSSKTDCIQEVVGAVFYVFRVFYVKDKNLIVENQSKSFFFFGGHCVTGY